MAPGPPVPISRGLDRRIFRSTPRSTERPLFPIRDSVIRSHPPVTVWAIIAANVATFLYQLSLGEQELQWFLYQHALVPRRYFFPVWGEYNGLSPLDVTPFLTNTFLHGGWLHIILNLWTLYIFGPALEDRLGPPRFLALYLLSGLAASIAHAVHGAIGISEEHDLQLYSRRLHEWRLADGSEGYWARALGQVRLEQPDLPSVDFIRQQFAARESRVAASAT